MKARLIRRVAAASLLIAALAPVAAARSNLTERDDMRRVNLRSPEFFVAEEDVRLFTDYSAFAVTNAATGEGVRSFHNEIHPQLLTLIGGARRHLIMSLFLYDSFYTTPPATPDVVGATTDAVVRRVQQYPELRAAMIFDPSHRAYSRRCSPAEAKLRAHGISVFYSDLIGGLRRAGLLGIREGWGHLNRLVDTVTGRLWGRGWSALCGRIPLPLAKFDDYRPTLESAYNAALVKANHRKLFVADHHGGEMELIVSTGNIHNPSAYHINHAVWVRGAPAREAYNLLREDMRHSAHLGALYSHWGSGMDRARRRAYFSEDFPPLPAAPAEATQASPARPVGIRLISEGEIAREIIAQLEAVQPDDEVDIQLFYLAYKPVLRALLEASTVVKRPIRLLLDANKDSFNKVKDGTPNRQVARYLLREAKARGGQLEIRWYATHGEQNHAKTLSIRNAGSGKRVFRTGSCNWTGRNASGINMEVNVVVRGSRAVMERFGDLFTRCWENRDGLLYSLPYEAFADGASDGKWRRGDAPLYWSTF
jgi:hypothetical protein